MMNNNADEEDLVHWLDKDGQRIKSFIDSRVSNKADAEDIYQDVFSQLFVSLQDISNPIEHVSSWLYRVSRNLIINKGKKKKEEEMPLQQTGDDDVLSEFSEILFNTDNSTPETEYLRSLVWDELDIALSKLPAEQREVFVLTEFDGLSIKEIEKTTGIKSNTLLSRKHYAVKYLREQLHDLYLDLMLDI